MNSSSAVYMKTGQGLGESSGKTNSLCPLDKSILARVDGKAIPQDIALALGLEPEHVQMVLGFLEQDGYIRPFISPQPSEPASAPSESSLHDTPAGSVDGLTLRARSSRTRPRHLSQSEFGLLPLGSAAPLPLNPGSIDQSPALSREARSAKLQAQLREAQRDREQYERLQVALKEAQERAEREAQARARAEKELAAAEELRAAREAAERERIAKEALAKEIADREKAERDAIEARDKAEASRLADIERARLRRLGVFKARARLAAYASVAIMAAAGALSLTQLIRVTPEICSNELSSWLSLPADVSSCDISMFPSPAIIATGILTKDGSIAVKRATLRLSIPSLAWGAKKIKSATLEDARLTSDGLMSATSSRKLSASQAGWLDSVSFENATLSAGSFEISGLSGSGKFLSNGSFESARFHKDSPAITIDTRLLKGVPTISIEARLAPESAIGQLGFEEASASGSLVSGGLSLDELTLRHPAGLVQARGVVEWSKSGWNASGPFEARSLRADALAPWLFLDGRSSIAGDYVSSGPTAESLLFRLSAKGSGKTDSAMVKLDIANAMGVGQTGGVSRFSSLNMSMSYANRSISVTDASARSGSLSARWSATRALNGSVRGSLTSSLASLQTGPMNFSISGNDTKLVLTPAP